MPYRSILDERARDRQRKRERQQLLRQAKDRPCADCGGTFHYSQMQFDHVRGVKEFGISPHRRHGGNVSRHGGNVRLDHLLAELAKCEVVCANCHALRTWKQSLAQREAAADPVPVLDALF